MSSLLDVRGQVVEQQARGGNRTRSYDRTSINSWEDVEFKEAVKALGRKKLISRVQLYCELQRDWSREATVPGFMGVFENFGGFNAEKAMEHGK